MKSDKSIHNIVIAKIKRSTILPYDFKWSKFYENNSEFNGEKLSIELEQEELIICSCVINDKNYSILTSKRLISCINNEITLGSVQNAKDKFYGEFKSQKENYTFGTVELKNGEHIKYFIETGRASMIMIQGVRTAIQIQQT